MNQNLTQRIEAIRYRGLTGEAAVETAYHTIFSRYDEPRSEPDLIMTLVNPEGFRKLFEMYFALHPEEAQKIVEEHNSKHVGLRKLLEPFAYFGNPVRATRYEAAKSVIVDPKN